MELDYFLKLTEANNLLNVIYVGDDNLNLIKDKLLARKIKPVDSLSIFFEKINHSNIFFVDLSKEDDLTKWGIMFEQYNSGKIIFDGNEKSTLGLKLTIYILFNESVLNEPVDNHFLNLFGMKYNANQIDNIIN
jgi:hypothetical protein